VADEQIEFKVGLDTSAVDSGIDKLQSKFIKLAAVLAGAFAFNKIISSAIEAEESMNKLNSALAAAGRYSAETSLEFKKMADELQATTIYSDDAVLSAAALAQNFAKTTSQAKELTRAAVNLSAATGRDLNSSVESLGRTLTGSGMALRQIGASTKSFTVDQLKAGAAIDFVNKRFAEMAVAQSKTFGGSLTILKNQFDNLLETIGGFITGNAGVRGLVVGVSKVIGNLTSAFENLNGKGQTTLQSLITGFLTVANVVTQIVLWPIEKISHLISGVAADLGVLSVVASQILSGEFKKAFETWKNTRIDAEELVKLDVAGTIGKQFDVIKESVSGATVGFSEFKNNLQTTLDDTESKGQKFIENMTSIFKTGSVKMMSAVAQGIGAVLAGNVGAFEALGNTMRGILGDMLIQAGEAMVAKALAFEQFKASIAGLFGGGGVAAGLLLIAAGAAIKGAAQAMTSPTLGAAGPTVTPVEPTSVAEPLERSTQVTVNVEGNILDPRGTGIAIKELLDTVFEANDARIVSA
jgi:hypothetical protein